MLISFTVACQVERIKGKFATREELTDALLVALENVDPDIGNVGPDGDTEYELVDVTVTPV